MQTKWIVAGVAVLLGIGAYFAFTRGTAGGQEIEYRYAPVGKDELVLSTSATGTLVALTKVDVKSKAGGKVVQLAVEEGQEVRKGDLIALIDPEDTRAVVEQAAADVRSAQARVDSARENRALQQQLLANAVETAQTQLEAARVRRQRVEEEAKRQPTLVAADLTSAREAVKTQEEAVEQLRAVDAPQRRKDATAALRRAEVDLSNANSELSRQRTLLEKGYVSRSAVERAETALATAQAGHDTAAERARTVEQAIASDIRASESRLAAARADLRRAEANQNQTTIAERNLQEARKAEQQAELALERARTDLRNLRLRELDVDTAEAGAVRSKVARDNAQVQLDSTTVLAPRDGVVTVRYLEEGTIVPPGTSTFAQGTNIVELSDVSRMFVDCLVDEAAISSVRVDQRVRIIIEAYPGQARTGIVRRIYPAAQLDNNVTRIRVRVEVMPEQGGKKMILRPGMTASCEFLLTQKPNVLIVPAPAVQREGDKAYVKVKTSDPMKPERREVKLGEAGNEGYEVLEGLNEGEEVVIAEVNLKELRERQQRMEAAEKGGGLTGQRAAGPGGGRR